VAGFAVMATGNLLTVASPWLAGAFAAQMLRGVAIPLADSHVTTQIQRTVPSQLLGRVLSNIYGGVADADIPSPATFVPQTCGGPATGF